MATIAGMETQFMVIVLLVWNIGLTIAVIVLAQKVNPKAIPSKEPDEEPEEQSGAAADETNI